MELYEFFDWDLMVGFPYQCDKNYSLPESTLTLGIEIPFLNIISLFEEFTPCNATFKEESL